MTVYGVSDSQADQQSHVNSSRRKGGALTEMLARCELNFLKSITDRPLNCPIVQSIHDEPNSSVPSPPTTKPVSEKEGSEVRKNFVPIPWRVIGGGVRVGIQKDEDEEDPESDSEDAYYSPEPPPPKKPAPIKSDTAYRPRSNSIPSTPSITQVRVDHVCLLVYVSC